MDSRRMLRRLLTLSDEMASVYLPSGDAQGLPVGSDSLLVNLPELKTHVYRPMHSGMHLHPVNSIHNRSESLFAPTLYH